MSGTDKKWLSIVGLVLIIGMALGFWLAHFQADSRGNSSAAATTNQAGRKVLYWHDPMVPGPKFDKPGKSPFMDMDLVPVYADEEGGAAVRIQPDAEQNLGIRLGKVERRTMQQQLRAVGTVSFDERRIEIVQTRVSGTVTRLYVKASSEEVHRGQALAELLAPEWVAAQQEYRALLNADSTSAQRIRDAARERLLVLGMPGNEIRAIESGRPLSSTVTLRAPIDGIVTELKIREGSGVMAGEALLQINGFDTVWVNAQIPESQVSLVAMNSSVQVNATAWPGVTSSGRVIALLPNVDAQTRTLPVRVAVENKDHRLAPGMYVALEFATLKGESPLTVPSEAVITTGERSVVIVAREQGGFDVAEVSPGVESDGYTAVLSGLTAGQQVVVSGQFLIDSEASLKSTVHRLSTTAKNMPAQQIPGSNSGAAQVDSTAPSDDRPSPEASPP